MSEIDPQTHDEFVKYWQDRYMDAIREGDYCKRMMGAAALRELDGVDE